VVDGFVQTRSQDLLHRRGTLREAGWPAQRRKPTSGASLRHPRGPAPGRPKRKVILLGACEAGTTLDEFLANCNSRIHRVAGHAHDVPQIEATLCDLPSIEHVVRGWTRCPRDACSGSVRTGARRGWFPSDRIPRRRLS